jgi:hypothetical protein
MQTLIAFFSGKKTYLIALAMIIHGWAAGDTNMVYEGFAMLFLRQGIAKALPPTTLPTSKPGGIVSALFIMAILGLLVFLFSACSRFATHQTDTSYDAQGNKTRTVQTHAAASTLLDSKSALANFKANQTDKTQSASVGSLTQESSGTNAAQAAGQFLGEIIKHSK